MSRERPTLKGFVKNIAKGDKITYGFVAYPSSMNGYRGFIPSRVFVKEDVLEGDTLREGMQITFDLCKVTHEKHAGKWEACNITVLPDNV